MDVECKSNQRGFAGSESCDEQARRYAWLELEAGNWHFLTHLFSLPHESSRRWSNEQGALEELIGEGWVVVGTYDQKDSSRNRSDEPAGYGLMRAGNQAQKARSYFRS
jgi:hypothetical protein